MESVWLFGPRYNRAYLLYRPTGRARQFRLSERLAAAAGTGSRLIRGRFVALFVDELAVDQIGHIHTAATSAAYRADPPTAWVHEAGPWHLVDDNW